MGYQMTLTDQQWFNLICGMNAGLAMKYKKAPFSELKKIDAPPGQTVEQAAELYNGNGVMVSVNPLTIDLTHAFEDLKYDHSVVELIGVITDEPGVIYTLSPTATSEEEANAIINASRIKEEFKQYKPGGRAYMKYSISQYLWMYSMIYGYSYPGIALEITKTKQIIYMRTKYTVTGHMIASAKWEPVTGARNCCIFGGGVDNNDPVYLYWDLYLSGSEVPSTIENFEADIYVGDTGSDERIAKAIFIGATAELTDIPQGLTFSTEAGLCGGHFEGVNIQSYLGRLKFGPLYPHNVSSGYVKTNYSFLIAYLKINDTIYYEHRPSAVYYADQSHGQLQDYFGPTGDNVRNNMFGWIDVGTRLASQPVRNYGETSGKTTGAVAEINASSTPKPNTYFVEKERSGSIAQDENDENNKIWSVGGESTDQEVMQDYNKAINECGYVEYKGKFKVDCNKTLYFYVADKVTGEQLTPSVPVNLVAGENDIDVKIPLVSEQQICGEYYVQWTEYISYSDEYESLEEAVENGGASYSENENKPKPYNTVVSQAGPSAPPLPVRPIGEDKIKINEVLDVIITTPVGPADLDEEDTVTIEEDIAVVKHKEYSGESDVSDNINISDDIAIVTHTTFDGTVRVNEQTSMSDDIDV